MGELEKWLQAAGLGDYVGNFADNDVLLTDIPHLTEEDLKELGLPLGPRRRLQRALAAEPTKPDQAADSSAPSTHSDGERRPVTVLFADLSGFTELSNSVDAEELHEILNRYFEVADRIIGQYGGTIDKHIGDSVMAVFGAPVARTNDPERAIRAALDIHAALPELSTVVGHSLTAHIGLDSGQVVASGTGSDLHREYTVTGDTVNLASRLGDLAQPGETLISSALYSSVSDICDCTEAGVVAVKGFDDAISTWRVDRLKGDQTISPRGAFVARNTELRQFEALARGCRENAEGCCLLIRGDPGIGKTRLAEELALAARDQGFQVAKSLVLDFGVSSKNYAISHLTHLLLGASPDDDPGARQAKLALAIAQGDLSPDAEIFANELLNLPQPQHLQNLYDEMESAARDAGSHKLLAELVMARSKKAPLLVFIEDIHWADTQTLDHISHLARVIADQRILLVMTTRVEGASTKEEWRSQMAGAPLTIFELQPLAERDAVQFARTLGHERSEDVENLAARSGGNPLFLLLLLRDFGSTPGGALPETLQGLVLARIDRLPPKEKEAVQAGSVIGQRVSLDLLRHLISDADYDSTALIEHRLFKKEADDLLFDHALIRDGVYASLLRDRKRGLHRRAAAWFAGSDPALHAEHLALAHDSRAPAAFADAAHGEAAHHRYGNALALVENGLSLSPDPGTKFVLHSLQGEMLELLNRFEDALAAFQAAQAVATSNADHCRALLGQGLALLRLDRHGDAEQLLERAYALAEAEGLDEERAIIHRRRATIEFARGDNEATFRESSLALSMAEACGLDFLKAEALSCMADAEAASGKFLSARSYYSQCVDICREHGFQRFAIINTKMLGDNAFYRGELQAARQNFEQVVDDAAPLGDLRSEALATNMLAYLDCLTNQNEDALNLARVAQDQFTRLEARRFLMNNHCIFAMALRGLEQRDDALKHLQDAEQIAEELDIVWAIPWVLGERALTLEAKDAREECLDKGMALLAAGQGGYFTFEFYRPAIETALQLEDWSRVSDLCDSLGQTLGNERVGFPSFLIQRAMALASSAQGNDETAALQSLREQAQAMKLLVDLPAIDKALASYA